MTRTQNFYYQNPMESIGDSVVSAIFGNPQLAQQQQQARAVIAEREAQARLHNAQADGYDASNAASASLPELLARLAKPNAPLPSLDDPNFAIDAAPSGPPPAPDANFRAGLPELVSALARMQGDKVNTGNTVGTLAAFLGGDELARRGLVAQGHSPAKDFAITPERADEIAANGYAADRGTKFGVAQINHANDIPVANIRRASAFDVARENNASDIPVARISAGSRERVAAMKSAGPAPGFDVIQKSFPGLAMNSGWRSPAHNRKVGGVDNSTHLGNTPGVQGYDTPVIPGMTVEQAAAKIEADNPGIRVIEAIDERGRTGPNGEALGGFHFALQNIGGKPGKGSKGAAAKPPKAINKAALDMIDAEFAKYYPPGSVETTAMNRLRSEAVTLFQQTGDPVGAVSRTIKARAERHRSKSRPPAVARAAALPLAPPEYAAEMHKGPPMQGARKAPDGHWYVQTGQKPDGAPSYSRVD